MIFAYVTAPNGLKIVDISDPTNPCPVANYVGSNHNGGADNHFRRPGLYVAWGWHGCAELGRSTSNPHWSLDFPGPTETVQTKLLGSQLLAADENLGVGVIDLTNPCSSRSVSRGSTLWDTRRT